MANRMAARVVRMVRWGMVFAWGCLGLGGAEDKRCGVEAQPEAWLKMGRASGSEMERGSVVIIPSVKSGMERSRWPRLEQPSLPRGP